jgi:hypothetical protein
MQKLSDSDKKESYNFLILMLGFVGMYFWVSSGIDHCGSIQNTGCMVSDSFDVITLLILIIMIVIGTVGWLWTLIGILVLAVFIIYKK